jgi:mRNA interferase MazF
MVKRSKVGKKIMPNFPRQSSVYWFDPEPVMGSEIRKIRPCIVVSPDEMNKSLHTVIVIPLTSTINPWPFRLNLDFLGQVSSAACDQIRSIDKTRLKAHIGDLKKVDSEKLFSLLQTMLSE